jgi:TolB-like protein/Flp pilus assembly protein TadD
MRWFFAELQRRNVLRAAALYGAGAWLLVQVATQVFPFFNISNDWVRKVVIAAVAGFPFALAVSWFYELTPEGLKPESEVDHSLPQARRASRRFDRWIIAVLVLALALALADIFAGHRAAAPEAGAAAELSIAVLPFESLSDDKANAYFADGIQDEILTRLAKIGSLRVIARTSTQQYGTRPANLSEIARQLGVANVLEGSVQLIRAATDDHLWAESYNRKLDDVFGVEGEVAQTVAEALRARLTGGERQAMGASPTANPQAYQAYLRGLGLELRVDTSPELARQVEDSFAEAVRLDPAFALAWAHLSMAHSYRFFNSIDSTPDLPQQAREAADTALRLQPELGEAHLAEGYYHYRCLRDYDGGLRAFAEAQKRLPNNADVLSAISYIVRRQGRWDAAVAHMEQAAVLDPRNIDHFVQLAGYYLALRRFPLAQETFDRALAVSPGDPDLLAGKAGAYQSAGDFDQAERLLAPLPYDGQDFQVFMAKIVQDLARRRFGAAAAALQAAVARPDPLLNHFLAQYYGYLGLTRSYTGEPEAAMQACTQSLKYLTMMRTDEAQDRELEPIFGLLHACLGHKEEALRHARHAVEISAGDAVALPQAEMIQAWVQAWLGDTDDAVAALPHLLQVPNGVTVADLRSNPQWDPLRKDPRFQKLIAGDGG